MIRAIELFAGVGGFRIGLERTNRVEIVWGNQWEPSKKSQHAFLCYSVHFSGKGTHSNEDINKVDERVFRDMAIDLIVGGFPCQDYSVARTLSGESGIQGRKGVLFWEIIRLAKAIKPKYMIFENVDRLLKSPAKQRGRDFSIILASFRDLGYSVEWRVINAAEYGQAQRRRRIFLIAFRNDIHFVKEKLGIGESQTLRKAGFFAPIFPVHVEAQVKHSSDTFKLPENILDIQSEFSVKYLNSGIMKEGVVYTEELVPIIEKPQVLREIIQTNVEEKYFLIESEIQRFKYLKGSKRIERVSKIGHKYIYTEGKVTFPDDLDKPGRTMLTSEGSINRSSHVVLDPDKNRLRFLTPVECERLNGFPDNWTAGMPDRMRYFCMGNALVTGIIKRIGQRLNEIDQIDLDWVNIKQTCSTLHDLRGS
ncbi:DNA (cytosine-5)-methyltransferase 1 [Mesobacillus persicus]|uniref:Cytosine-specific methyltransferase n=1 Tax=Mesobacillus persicus TaxID=930146 RepID=A0A1H8D074_9BACI|nr:DNA (cytosine-5-)-methyltransferase [Mesobacillus persicus]SEN00670.1 DNA (cytosine-5)-methyltransferase 1 [Mesobacillus persicus]